MGNCLEIPRRTDDRSTSRGISDADALTKHLTFVLTSAELKPDDVELLEKSLTCAKVTLWQGDWLRAELGYRYAISTSNKRDAAANSTTIAEARKELIDSVAPVSWSLAEDRFKLPSVK